MDENNQELTEGLNKVFQEHLQKLAREHPEEFKRAGIDLSGTFCQYWPQIEPMLLTAVASFGGFAGLAARAALSAIDSFLIPKICK